jgi:hypothetical protein
MPGIMSEDSDAGSGPRCGARRPSRCARPDAWGRRRLQEGVGRGAKEHAVDDLLVLKCHRRERLRQREDDMKVLSRQQLSGALLESRSASSALAFRTMAIAAGTIRDRLIITSVTLLGVAAERNGAARRDVPQRFPLPARERLAKRLEVSWTVDAENVTQLERRRVHRAGVRPAAVGSRSSGLAVVRTARLETCRYLAVVLRLRCPSRIWMRRRSIASSSR